MRCLSCQNEVKQSEAKLVLGVYLCAGCGAIAEKGVKELELESARALELAKHTFSQHIMQGGLLRPGAENRAPDPPMKKVDKGTST